MSKFKIRDRVIVVNSNFYMITENGSYGKVVEDRGDWIKVEFDFVTGKDKKLWKPGYELEILSSHLEHHTVYNSPLYKALS